MLNDGLQQISPIKSLNGFHNKLRPIFTRVLQPPIVHVKHGRRVTANRKNPHVHTFIADARFATDNGTFEQMSFAGELSGGCIDGDFANDPDLQTTFFLDLTHGRLFRAFPRINAPAWQNPNRNIATFDQQNILFFVVKNDGSNTIFHEADFSLMDNTL